MNPLIATIDELRQFVTFSGDIDLKTLKPAIRSAQNFLVTYVGWGLLENLSQDNLGDDDKQLLPFVQAPIANLALLKFVQSGNVRITDLGLMRTKTADSSDAFEWQVQRIVTALQQQAFDDIETLLNFLAQNLDKYPAYTDSDEFKRDKSRLITSATQFSQFYQIGASRLIFETLSSSLYNAEDQVLSVLGDSVTALLGSSPTDGQKIQLKAARKALVYLTIARALRERLVSITEGGVQISGISQFGTLNYRDPASDKQLERSIAYFDQQATAYLSELATLLKPVIDPSAQPTGSRISGTAIVSF